MDNAPCVVCRVRPAEAPWKPFCSHRCKMVDLGRWLGGHYRVPGEPIDDPMNDADAPDARIDRESAGDPE